MDNVKSTSLAVLTIVVVSIFFIAVSSALSKSISVQPAEYSGGAVAAEDEEAEGGGYVQFGGNTFRDTPGGVDAEGEAQERIAGLPEASELKRAWQLDFSCENAASAGRGSWFAKSDPVESRMNVGYGSSWNFLKMVPNIKNPAGENVGLSNYSFEGLSSSNGVETGVQFQIQGTAGCYTRPVTGGDTSAQSITGDYIWVDHVQIGTYGPVEIIVSGLEDGRYQMGLITAYDASHGREWTAEGEGFTVDVPFKPGSITLEGNYEVTPEFQVDDGEINLRITRGPALAGLAERDGSMAGMVIVMLN